MTWLKQNWFKVGIITAVMAGFVIFAGVYTTVDQRSQAFAQEAQKQKDLEVENLRQEVEALKNKKPETITQTIVREVPAQQTQQNDLPSIISHWRPKIAHITCEFSYSTGEPYLQQAGSGFVTQSRIRDAQGTSGGVSGIIVVTNRHVITDEGKYRPSSCTIKFPDDSNAHYIPWAAQTFAASDYGYDLGQIFIHQPDDYLKNLMSSSPSSFLCSKRPVVGDRIVILGYPGIGSQSDITATEGIISGYDGDYFITSAKVEHGNSGGAAISVKDNCYIGVPSYAEVGSTESLARVLDGNLLYR